MSDLLHRRAGGERLLIGVCHLGPLPGAPRFRYGSLGALLEAAAADARALVEGGADAVIVENFGDAPFFPERVPPETIAAMALALETVADAAPELAVGVNVLRNDARAALGLCSATQASFLRVNVHVGAMVTDQGLVEGHAAETLRERTRLAPETVILADVHVKHAAPLRDGPIDEAALETLERGGADAVIVSGSRTGAPPTPAEVARVAEMVGAERVLIGSGVNFDNAHGLLAAARGAIVGTLLREDGDLGRPVVPQAVARLRAVFDRVGC